jgi:hypothetical protein
MVRPYLWRFSPTEPGPGLRPRPRSRFEPAPRLPIDGPAIQGRSVSWPPTSDAETAGVEIEVEQDAPSGELPSHGEHRPAPRAEQRLPPYSERTTQQPPEKPLSTGSFVGNSRGSAPDSGEEASVRPTIGEVAVRRPLAPPPPTATPDLGFSTSESHQVEPPPMQGAAAQASPPMSRQVFPPAPQQIPPSAPGQGPRPAPRRQVDRPTPPGQPAQLPASAPAEAQPRATIKPQPPDDELPADRIQAVARSLRHANAHSAGPEATRTASTDPALPPPPPPAPSRPATHTDVSVTIGRIEVTAPAPDPVPAQPRSSAPRRRPATLAEYLEVRTRARGRAG